MIARRLVIIAASLALLTACGDSTGPAAASDTAPTASSLSTSAAATPTPAVALPSAVAAKTVVTFLNAPLAVKRGSNATLQAKTVPNTSCAINVEYKSGPSTAAGLVTKTSDGAGNVSWTWKVGANTTPGSWPITVTCGDASAQTQINVT